MFQIDRPDLDFGIYRILNSRQKEIAKFLEKDLPNKISETLADSNQQNAVFNHLLTFFSRYYDEGDFISQRRYKGDTYAIPYSGEEVMLHWANKDQYYTKSGENFTNYRFSLADNRTVEFRLIDADTAKDNRKDDDNSKRVFMLAKSQLLTSFDDDGEEVSTQIEPVSQSADGKVLTIRFEYKLPTNKGKQADYISQAHEAIASNPLVADWQGLFDIVPTEKDTKRTLLKKQLDDYVAKNSKDYFIHKDLGGFLKNELDFYIKNELMNLDNLQSAQSFADIEANLTLIQTFRTVALQIVAFLAQLENFQKKLWLKKKFVSQAHYLITLNHIPEQFHAEIASNARQLEQWQSLFNFSLDQGVSFADTFAKNPYLVVDTSLFPASFQANLLSELHDLDEQTNGLLIHSDNFQALNLLQAKYREQVKCIYIDPPYNTGSDNDFLYKDNYQHSSWVAMMMDRFSLARNLMQSNSTIWVSTDDGEYSNVKNTMDNIFGNNNFVADVIWNSRKSISNDALISVSTNHTTLYAKFKDILDKNKSKFRLPESLDGFINPDNDPRGHWKLDPLDAPNIRANLSYGIENPKTGEVFYPPEGRCWRFEEKTVMDYIKDKRILFGRNGNGRPAFKRFYEEAKEKGKTANTLWDDVGTTTNGTKFLHSAFHSLISKDELNKIKPKPVELIEKIFNLNNELNPIYIDYFSGSGTSGHAVINLNREDQGKRKYILVEQGQYFDTVLKPRIQKVVYSKEWKDGKPQANADGSFDGVPQIVKVLKLESYEDTLNNLQLAQPQMLDLLSEQTQQDYLLHYMLDVESRGSLLNTEQFKQPFDYQLNIATSSAGAYSAQNIDLIETFNYLTGLKVTSIDDKRVERGYVLVYGELPTGENTLVVWRDCTKVGYEQVAELFERLDIKPNSREYDVVYLNGDNAIPTQVSELNGETEQHFSFKLRPIEPEFLTLMFSE
ncbi:restriction endonuclease subunit M [Pasteurellaceae bacterium LFhippo2]|nr:restriction endonuclease subunit M [Pasteurellaceae bacterium LFhippo2]